MSYMSLSLARSKLKEIVQSSGIDGYRYRVVVCWDNGRTAEDLCKPAAIIVPVDHWEPEFLRALE